MNRKFLYYIEEAKRYSKKVILMPQSFGPFDYEKDKDEMLTLIKRELNAADLVFAREVEGFTLLKESFGVSNLQISPDLVLQSGDIDWSNIYISEPETRYPLLKSGESVAIIPNTETFKHGSEEAILDVYKHVIKWLLLLNKNIYIFRHSNDLMVCKKIYREFEHDERVHLIKDEFECTEYSEFVKQFEFIVASRFHSIIHAYKEGIPAIIFGWAIKYQELARLFEQTEYVFDITKKNLNPEQIIKALDNMNTHNKEERLKLIRKIKKLKECNCFDLCWDTIYRDK
jgi:colanic acid/amylovoran biosynthesis protein